MLMGHTVTWQDLEWQRTAGLKKNWVAMEMLSKFDGLLNYFEMAKPRASINQSSPGFCWNPQTHQGLGKLHACWWGITCSNNRHLVISFLSRPVLSPPKLPSSTTSEHSPPSMKISCVAVATFSLSTPSQSLSLSSMKLGDRIVKLGGRILQLGLWNLEVGLWTLQGGLWNWYCETSNSVC